MMASRFRMLAWAGLLAASVAVTIAVALTDTTQQDLSLAVAVGGVTEGLHTVDRLGMAATRISLPEEVTLGDTIARQVEAGYALAPRAEQDYARAIVAELAAKGALSRPTMPYRVLVLDSGEVNAYALPGGHVYITTAMLALLGSEAEVAAILGHEIAHVDKKHCIERLQYEVSARKLGGAPLEALVSIGSVLLKQGFSAELETEADRQGTLYAARAGYHPQAGQLVFARLSKLYGEAKHAPRSLGSEIGGMLRGGLEQYFRSHPGDEERIARYERAFAEHGLNVEGAQFYIGTRNLRERTPRRTTAYAEELVRGRIYP